jgi:hypothetical protein
MLIKGCVEYITKQIGADITKESAKKHLETIYQQYNKPKDNSGLKIMCQWDKYHD